MTFNTIFFDLDDTLYDHESGLWKAVKARISLYMHERIGLSWEEIPSLRDGYYQNYGTTLRGLKQDYNVNERDYHDFVHNLPLAEYIAPDPDLIAILEHLPQRKVILTSADADHARRVLAQMQISAYFERILDIYAIAPYAKPQHEAFQRALDLVGESEPRACVLIDDLPKTTHAARAFGMFSILKGNKGTREDANAILQHWRDFPSLLNGHKS